MYIHQYFVADKYCLNKGIVNCNGDIYLIID